MEPRKIIPVTIVNDQKQSSGGCCGGGSHNHATSGVASSQSACCGSSQTSGAKAGDCCETTETSAKSAGGCCGGHDESHDPRGLKRFADIANTPVVRTFDDSDHLSAAFAHEEDGRQYAMNGMPLPSPRKNLAYSILGTIGFLALIVGIFVNSLNPVRVKAPQHLPQLTGTPEVNAVR